MSLMSQSLANSRRQGGAGGRRLSALAPLVFALLAFAPAYARAQAPSTTPFTAADVGLSTVQFNWSASTPCYRAEIALNDTFTPGYLASSTTANAFAIFGTTNPLAMNTSYYMRVASFTASGVCGLSAGITGAFSVVAATTTLPTINTVRNYLPTPPGSGVQIYGSTNPFQFSASTGPGVADLYLSTWNQTAGAYAFSQADSVGAAAQWDGSTKTYTATSEGAWYHHVAAMNAASPRVYTSTQVTLSYVYDAQAPAGTGFLAVNGSSNVLEGTWINRVSQVSATLTIQDLNSGLSVVGYSSGTNVALIDLWHFDEGSGLKAANSGIGGPGGTSSDTDGFLRANPGGTPPQWVPGRFGKALNFTPAGLGYVDTAYRGPLSDPRGVGNPQNETLSAWINLNSSTQTADQYIISRWDVQAGDGKIALFVRGGNKPAFRYKIGSGVFDLTGSAIPAGTWTYLAGVVDGNNGRASLYINGVLSTFTFHGGPVSLVQDLGNPTLVGAATKFKGGTPVVPTQADGFFDGLIDEPRVFNNSVSCPLCNGTPAEEIALDYAAGLGWLPLVQVSTTGGATWVTVASSNPAASPRWSLGGAAHGQTTAASFSLINYDLTTSTSALTGAAGTNQVRYYLTDRAGNEMAAGPFTVLVDTTAPVSSAFAALSSSGGASGSVVPLPEATWGALSSGVTVQVTLQDITSGVSLSTGDYQVRFSTNGGSTFNTVVSTFLASPSEPYVSLTGVTGSTAAQTLAVKNLGLVQSEEDTDSPVRNQIVFLSTDQARNTLVSQTFVVKVDTTPPGALTALTPLTPYAASQIQLNWVAPGNNGLTGNLVSGSAFLIQYTTTAADAGNPSFWNPANAQVVIATTTSAATRLSSHTVLVSGLLNGGTVYYFRGFAKDPAGNFGPLSFGATAATLAPPQAPGGLAAAVNGASSITWTWNQTVLTSTYALYTDADVFVSSISTNTATFARTALSTNTLYGLKVSGVNPAGQGLLTASVTNYTLAARPGLPVLSSVSYSSVTFSWAANGNPSYTDYEVSLSSDGFSAFVSTPVAFSSVWTQAATTLLSLNPGTSYYLRVRAQNKQSNDGTAVKTALSPATTTQTLPTPPTVVSSATLGISSITWAWSNTAGGATQFRVLRAADGANLSGSLASAIGPGSGLIGHWRFDGDFTDSSGQGNTLTAGGAATTSSAQKRIGSAAYQGDGTNTTRASRSSLSGWSGGNAPVTLSAWVYFTNISANTGQGVIAVGSPSLNSRLFARIANANWPLSNPLFPNCVGTERVVVVSADPDGSTDRWFCGSTQLASGQWNHIAVSYDGANVKLYVNGALDNSAAVTSMNLGTNLYIGGDGYNDNWLNGYVDDAGVFTRALSLSEIQQIVAGSFELGVNGFVQTSLATNTAYGVSVEAFVPTGSGGFTPQTTAYTRAVVPGTPALVAAASATTSSLGMGWAANGNPSYTRYEVGITTDPAYAGGISLPVSFTAGWTPTTTTFIGLAPGTSYFFKARAENNETLGSGPVLTDQSALGPSQTIPAAISGLTFSTATVSTDTAKWTFNPSGNGNATQYKFFRNVDGGVFSDLAADLSITGFISSTYTATALQPNHHYSFKAQPFTATGSTATSIEVGGYTLANPPNSLTVVQVFQTSATLTWNASSNSGFTRYQVRRSTDEFVGDDVIAVSFTSNMTLTTAAVTGLAPFTTYQFRVNAISNKSPELAPANAFQTTFSNVISTFTLAPTISNIAGAAQSVSAIAWSWDPVLNASTYSVFSTTSSTLLVSTPNPSFTLTGLSTNTAYGISVRAENFSGIGVLSPGVTRYTLAAVPAQPVFLTASSQTVALSWDAQGNPAGTRYELSSSLDAFAASFSTPIAFTQSFTALTTTLSGLASGTAYSFRVRARNGDGTDTAFSATGSTRTLGIPGTITDLRANSFFPGRIDLSWTAPGANGASGAIADGQYVVHYSTKASDMLAADATVQALLAYSAAITPGVAESTAVIVPNPINDIWGKATFYLAVYTRNDDGVFSARSSTVTRIAPNIVRAFTIDVATPAALALGSLPLSSSVVLGTPVTLVSTGNVSTTFVLQGSTGTSGSSWQLAEWPFTGTPPDTMRLVGAFNDTKPASFSSFTSGGAIVGISTAPRVSDAGTYAITGAYTGAAIPPAITPGASQTRKFWTAVQMPPYTSTDTVQTFGITINATSP